MNIVLRRNPNRALTALSPFYHPMTLIDEIEGLAQEMWDSWQPVFSGNSFMPHTEMYEEKDQLVVKTELPGIQKEELDVSLEGDVLTIKAKKKQEEVTEDATYYTRERHYGEYYRSVSLPFHVDGDKTSATFENGLLELRLPKAEEAKTKHIEVKAQIPQGEQKKRQRKSSKKSS